MMKRAYHGSAALAIDGGSPVRKAPLAAWPKFSEEEVSLSRRILESGKVNYWTGEECRAFETEFAAYLGLSHAVALANGTLALELALRVLGIGKGDEVIVTPRSYFASASSVVLAGATPVFAEVDRDTQNITAATIEPLIGRRTKAILVVHLAGWPCHMSDVMEVARAHNLRVIEDCAQAHGASFNGKPVGSFGDIGCFSFCQDKIMSTAGEGGMLVTRDKELWPRAWSFKDHGKSWQRVYRDDHPHGFRWLHDGFGSNYRMTEIQGGIGRIQLKLLDEWIGKRRQNAAQLVAALSTIPALRVPVPSEREFHSYYKFYAFVNAEALQSGWSRDRILVSLEAEGIPGWSGSCPEIYREKAFRGTGHDRLPIARELGETSMMLPVHPTLSGDEIEDIIAAVHKVMVKASA